jgi:tRNA pseudouridine55 synthase
LRLCLQRRAESSGATVAIPKGLEPTGVILVDKPAGPSSFAVLAGVRSRTRAKTGHAGTLDPFATGLLILLSGGATTMASCFVGLPKRYLTDVDLSRRTTTGDPEGEALEAHDVPARSSLDAALEDLRGEIELPIPTASAVKIGGERAYKLHRQGVVVEMPLRRSQVDALDVIAYTEGIATLDLRVSSGTYVRSIADALGGHCVSLRRTEVGPFSVEEADAERVLSLDEALGRIGMTVAEAEAERRQKADADRRAHEARKASETHGADAAGAADAARAAATAEAHGTEASANSAQASAGESGAGGA